MKGKEYDEIVDRLDNMQSCMIDLKINYAIINANYKWLNRIMWIFIPAILGIDIVVILKLFGIL
jgi:hypothetical protein